MSTCEQPCPRIVPVQQRSERDYPWRPQRWTNCSGCGQVAPSTLNILLTAL
ncbi:hypothetical protein DPMN_006972 [Dreissena polymorpha]|uniref:Uncharacterized protein n=1 Tax=Dreissena polymorpha TaxID=45954 RepID=A0A9D4MWF3_DREPO|nr:hypothetical protein DPMN_006972 [Dreissena polymorpha]